MKNLIKKATKSFDSRPFSTAARIQIAEMMLQSGLIKDLEDYTKLLGNGGILANINKSDE